ncbi:MAG TPA: M14 family zinc carboxypeptidase [Mycobacteriales bacterium]|nr:M14 family zinc carboxypeptidase [Mycobacteriales bacterium]
MSARSSRLTAVTALVAVTGLGLALSPASALVAPADQAGSTVATVTNGAFAPQLVTVAIKDDADKTRLAELDLDLTEHAGHDYVEVVLHSVEDGARLLAAGFTWDVRIPDLLARELERVELDATYAASTEVSPLPSGRTTYRQPADYATEIDALVAARPDIAKRISIGKSVEGRDLTGIEIGRDVNAPEDGRPVFLMFGAHHAREWPSAELPMEFATDLVRSFGSDERITSLLSRGRIIIVPVSNPDGFHASRVSGDVVDLRQVDRGGTVSILGTPGNAYKRKNCRYVDGQAQPAGTCVAISSPGGFGPGVDLNRNYGALWGGPGTESNPASPIYRGPKPFSEPETQAIRNLISTRQVTTLITNHTFSNLILRPVGVKPSTTAPDGDPVGFAPDECFTGADGVDNGMQALGERMAAQNGYKNQFGWELYDTTGTTEDYSYNATGGYGYTFEIGAHEFHPPFQEVVAEYTGDNPAAKGVTPAKAASLTTAAADKCGGLRQTHEQVGGGNREAFLLAFENAVDAGTHSLITGVAPAGATLTLERTGVFPLWDGSKVADTVKTAMVVGADGRFSYHANPSTRPFVQSRKAGVLGEPKDTLSTTGNVAPASSTRTPFVVTQPAQVLKATLTQSVGTGETVVRNMSLNLLNPAGEVVATANAFAASNTLAWTGPDGQGVPAGTYTLRVNNTAGVVPAYSLTAATHDVVSDRTARQFEQWTLSCITDKGVVGQQGISVERGQSVDAGDVCNAGLGVSTDPAPVTGKVKKPKSGGKK